ncbi:hypothetical protein M0R45_035928 [Rubus argutus]|uniref:Uncharacterized protein n=1 Tax=Rubus argutus TaxID=59490 RepID=A0AAW1VYV6_RUBAR
MASVESLDQLHIATTGTLMFQSVQRSQTTLFHQWNTPGEGGSRCVCLSPNRDAISWVRTGTDGCKLMHNAIGEYTFPVSSVQSRGFARITPSLVGLDLHVFSVWFCLMTTSCGMWELQTSEQKLITIRFAVIARLLLPSGEMGVSLGEVLIPVE